MKYRAKSHGNFEFDFPRVCVILGANGSGKSTLLKGIKNFFHSVYIEGGRTITIDDTIALTRQNINQYKNLESAMEQYRVKRSEKLVDRLTDALLVLMGQGKELKGKHSDEVTKWDTNGKVGDFPRRPQLPLDRLFEQYTEIFPYITVSYNDSTGKVTINNNISNAQYGPSSLSDGEKQVFSLLADMLQLEDVYDFVVVDEPELNLHPELAERLWNLLESEYQNKHFLLCCLNRNRSIARYS